MLGDFEANPKDWKIYRKSSLPDRYFMLLGVCYCKCLNPILDEFAKEFDGGDTYIYKVDVDQRGGA